MSVTGTIATASACARLERCIDRGANAIVTATVTHVDGDAWPPAVTLDVTSVFGYGIAAGSITLPVDAGDDFTPGTMVVLEVGTFGGTELRILAGGNREPCFAGIPEREEPCGDDPGWSASPFALLALALAFAARRRYRHHR
jgi:MYXO-CTERM domain-containing protein